MRMTAQAPPPPHALFMDRRHGCQGQRASWGPSLMPPLPQPHASVSSSAPHPKSRDPPPLTTFLESVPSPPSGHPLPASDYPITSGTCCPHLSRTAPLKASRCCTGSRAGRGLGKEATQHWLASLRVTGMMESGQGREPWLLDHRTGTSDSEYIRSSVLRWGTGEALCSHHKW